MQQILDFLAPDGRITMQVLARRFYDRIIPSMGWLQYDFEAINNSKLVMMEFF
jgi:hypothetical protein